MCSSVTDMIRSRSSTQVTMMNGRCQYSSEFLIRWSKQLHPILLLHDHIRNDEINLCVWGLDLFPCLLAVSDSDDILTTYIGQHILDHLQHDKIVFDNQKRVILVAQAISS